jgi:hypothetical protein
MVYFCTKFYTLVSIGSLTTAIKLKDESFRTAAILLRHILQIRFVFFLRFIIVFPFHFLD